MNLIDRVHEKRFDKSISKKLIERYIDAAENINNVFVLSTSVNNDNPTLWYNYSKDDGYNIGLDFKQFIDLSNNNV